jgi:hypothetical protein
LENGSGLEVTSPHAGPRGDLQNIPLRTGGEEPAEQEEKAAGAGGVAKAL